MPALRSRTQNALREPNRWRRLPAFGIALLFLLPLIYMVTGSLRELGLPPPRTPEFLPWPPAFSNYERAFALGNLGRQLLNSLIVVGAAVPLTILFASWAGFALSRLSRKIAGFVVGVSLLVLMVPDTAFLVSRFALFRTLGLTDTLVPLIAPSLMGTSPFYVLLFYWSFRRLPQELFEACRLEGLKPLQIWWKVAMPLVRPITVAVGVLAAVFTWSDFLDPLIYLFDPSKYTLPLGLRSLATLDRTQFPVFLAGAVVATAPVVVAFLYVQRHFLHEYRGTGWLSR
jgi:multiple sugar transport system permease protein